MPTALSPKTTFLADTAHAFSPLMPKLALLLPPDITLEAMKGAMMLYVSEHQDDLFQCSPHSLRACALESGMRGMLPGRDCHWLPFTDKRKGPGKHATFVPTYEGIILALERTGKVAKAFAHAVYSQEHFRVDYLADVFEHQPALGAKRGTLVCFYGCILLLNGTRHIQVMSLEEVNAIRDKAPAHESGPWASHYEAMGRKTALKQVAKYVRLTPAVSDLMAEEDAREASDISPARIERLIAEMWGREPRESGEREDAALAPVGSGASVRTSAVVKTPPAAARLTSPQGLAADEVHEAHDPAPDDLSPELPLDSTNAEGTYQW